MKQQNKTVVVKQDKGYGRIIMILPVVPTTYGKVIIK